MKSHTLPLTEVRNMAVSRGIGGTRSTRICFACKCLMLLFSPRGTRACCNDRAFSFIRIQNPLWGISQVLNVGNQIKL